MSLVFEFALSSNHKTIPIGTGTSRCDFQVGQVPTLVNKILRSIMNVKPPTKVRQYSHIKADATSVMNKSFEKLLSNNFQVIIFERMAKNYFKVNILYKIC